MPFSRDIEREELLRREKPSKILEYIRAHPGIRVKDLETKLGYKHGATSYYVRQLKLKGFVEKTIDGLLIPARRWRIGWATAIGRSTYDIVLNTYCYEGPFSYENGEPKVKTKSLNTRIQATVSCSASTGEKARDVSFLRQAQECIWRTVLPLLILSSLPQIKTRPVNNKVDLTVSIDYSIPSYEHLWDLMNAFENSESMEDLTDADDLGGTLRQGKVGRLKRELGPLVSQDFVKKRMENPVLRYGVLCNKIGERIRQPAQEA